MLVRLEPMGTLELVLIMKRHFCRIEMHPWPGLFGEEVCVDRARVREVDDQPVAAHLGRTVTQWEQTHDGLIEANRDDLATLARHFPVRK